MNEPLPNKKTNILVAAFIVLQGLAKSGLVPAELPDATNDFFAAGMALTLALKGLRHYFPVFKQVK